MTTFDSREQAMENLYMHDEELTFKARSHAAKLFGGWAAQQAGLPDNYGDGLVSLIGLGKDEADVIRQVQADAAGKGCNLSAPLLQEKFAQCLGTARTHVAEA